MAENQGYRCSGDCLKCHPEQRQYCASQFTFNTMKMVEHLIADFNKMVGTAEEMKVKIEALQNNEALLFNPTAEVPCDSSQVDPASTEESRNLAVSPTDQPIAQSGDGAV